MESWYKSLNRMLQSLIKVKKRYKRTSKNKKIRLKIRSKTFKIRMIKNMSTKLERKIMAKIRMEK